MITDKLTLSDVGLTPEGFLVGNATIGRTGVQLYTPRELGIEDAEPNRMIRVYRPESEVFDAASMESFRRKPVTDDHPKQLVNSRNARELTRGFSGDAVVRDGDLLSTTITIMDQGLIENVQQGTRQISNGYEADVEFTDGTTPGGEAFDAVMRNIVGNHIAIVRTGKCGPSCRFGDGCDCDGCQGDGVCDQNGAEKVTDKLTLKSVKVDGYSFEVNDQAVELIDKLQSQLGDAKTENEALQAKLADTVSAHDEAMGEKVAEIKKLTDAAIKPEDLDRMVADRQDIADKAKLLNDSIDITGKSIEDIRREAVTAAGIDVKDESDDFVRGIFTKLVADADGKDELRDTIRTGPSRVVNARDKAYEDKVNDLSNRWRTAGAPVNGGAQ